MDTLRIGGRQGQRILMLVALGIITIALSLLPLLAAADTVTDRSVKLSTAAKGATSVTYSVNYTAATDNTGSFVVEFCANSPVVGDSCSAPTGFDVTSGVGTSGSDTVAKLSANSVQVDLSAQADKGSQVSVDLTGITNPSDAGTFYARIVTYENSTDAANYQTEALGNYLDSGSVALPIVDKIGVSGAVLESLIFCASGEAIGQDGCEGSLKTPSITLGQDGVLDTTVSDGTIYSLISTNASSGAVVSLKSDAKSCGGLVRAGAPTKCDITPLTVAGPIEDAAKFGLKLANINNGTGTITPAGDYSTSKYFMNYVSGDASGVTSTYGDPIFNTNAKPISNGAVNLTFGAAVTNDTPAGDYSANLSLIATGKF